MYLCIHVFMENLKKKLILLFRILQQIQHKNCRKKEETIIGDKNT